MPAPAKVPGLCTPLIRGPVAWSYLRWSTPPQDWGDSERRQLEPSRDWAKRRRIKYRDEYRDEGIGAWRGTNVTEGDLGRFLADVGSPDPDRPQPGDYLVVENPDRLTRYEYVFKALAVIADIFEKRITLVFTYETGFDGLPGLEINEDIVRQHAHLGDWLIRELQRGVSESTKKSVRIGAARQAARERAWNNNSPLAWGTCPGWLDLVDVKRIGGRIIAGRYQHNKNADVLVQIFEWAAMGRGGAWIAHQLNSAKPPVPVFKKIGPKWEKRITKGDEPKWHPNVIRALLKDRRVMGYLQPCRRVNGKRVPVGPEAKLYPEVISPDLFARVAAARRSHSPGRKDRPNLNLVQGRCRCELCRKGVVIRPQRGRDYLVCEMARHGDCPNGRYFPYLKFEHLLIRVLYHDLGVLLAPLLPPTQPQSEVEPLESKLADLRARRKRLIERFAKGDPDADELIQRLEKETAETEQALAIAKEDDLVARHDEDPRSAERIQKALERLYSINEGVREEARSVLSTELKRRVDKVILRPDRTLRVLVNDGHKKHVVFESIMTPDEITSFRVLRRDNEKPILGTPHYVMRNGRWQSSPAPTDATK